MTDEEFEGIDNVFVYVADAVRWDALPQTVAERGAVAKTVAASIHSPTSFASLATGQYLPGHGVTDFDHRIPDTTFSLFDLDGLETRFVNTIGVAGGNDPIFPVLRYPPTDATDPFCGLMEPFVAVERSQGGHAPYGGFDGTAKEYFSDRRGASIDRLKTEYRRGVRRDARAFGRRLDALSERGLLDSTLVIYTADHGELLGEGGLFGHTGVVRPELVSVPTVFVHPTIDSRRLDGLFRHVDLLPTVLDAVGELASLGDTRRSALDGVSIRSGTPIDRGCSFYHVEHTLGAVPYSPASRYDSVWDATGGYVFARSPPQERLIGLLGDVTQSVQRSFVRRHLLRAITSYLSAEREFGTADFSPAEAQTTLDALWRDSADDTETRFELTEDAREHLQDMGYLK